MNEQIDDSYIFFQEDPLAPMKVEESRIVRAFSKSLTAEEKAYCREYIAFLKWPVKTHQQRMNRNLAVMCFCDGLRYARNQYEKNNPSEGIYTAVLEKLQKIQELLEMDKRNKP